MCQKKPIKLNVRSFCIIMSSIEKPENVLGDWKKGVVTLDEAVMDETFMIVRNDIRARKALS